MMTIGVQKECAIKEWLETRYMLSCILKHFISVRSNRPNFPWDKDAYKIHTQNTERDRLTETERQTETEYKRDRENRCIMVYSITVAVLGVRRAGRVMLMLSRRHVVCLNFCLVVAAIVANQ